MTQQISRRMPTAGLCSMPDSRLTANRRQERKPYIEVIERTRQLMERTIEFIDQPSYGASDAMQLIQAKRPHALNQSDEVPRVDSGRTFISALVTKPPLSIKTEQYWFELMNYLKYRAEQNRRSLDLSRIDIALVKRIDHDLEEALRIRNHIVESNLRLVVALARQFSNVPDQMSELIGEGMPPLIRSVELFDVGLGNHFSTYATWSVRNEMVRFFKRQKVSALRFPKQGSCLLENIPDNRSASASDQLESRVDAQVIHRGLASLTEREKIVILARYGFDGQRRRRSLADIGAQVGLCGERVRQLISSGLSKLRDEIQIEDRPSID